MLSNFKHPYMRIFSTLFSSEVVYVRPGGQLRQKRGWFASRWGPLLRAHSRCSGGHPPERSGSHSWSSSFMRGRKSGGGRSYIRARVAVACEPRSSVCVGPGYRHSNPCVQSRLHRELSLSLSARVCSTLCAVVSRIWRKGNGGDKAIRRELTSPWFPRQESGRVIVGTSRHKNPTYLPSGKISKV